MKNYIKQKTVKRTIEFAGVALHSGAETSIRILPGDPDTGYRFRRTDIAGQPEVAASVHNIRDTMLATSLELNGTAIKTVEHLLSAMAGCGIDNAVIEVDGEEIPIMDGSAMPFVNGIDGVGLKDQEEPKRMLRILKEIEVMENGAGASLIPSEIFQVSFTIDFEHPVVGWQDLDFRYTPESFREEIAFARTFGFLKDVQMMMDKGLALGGSMENAVVVGDDKVLNPGGLRSPDEFVRHKVLDTLGDLSLLGIPIVGAYYGYKAGHRINRLLMQEVLAHPDHWDLVLVEEKQDGLRQFSALEVSDEQPLAYAL